MNDEEYKQAKKIENRKKKKTKEVIDYMNKNYEDQDTEKFDLIKDQKRVEYLGEVDSN